MYQERFPFKRALIEAGIYFNEETSRFETTDEYRAGKIINSLSGPLSVILQITRRCNMKCLFCSENDYIRDTNYRDLVRIRANLKGTPRIFLSGGEPAIRKDLPRIIDLFHDSFIIGLPTNALIPNNLIPIIKKKIAFVNVGLDGPRNITKRLRGDYDLIMQGINKLVRAGINISLTAVVIRSTMSAMLYTCQIADAIGALKLKMISPVPKGRALKIPRQEYLTKRDASNLYQQIRRAKKIYGWSPIITITAWTPEVEGYSILIHPNGKTYAWPVYDKNDKLEFLGNVIDEPISEIWRRYPFKLNNINKYLELVPKNWTGG